MTRLENGHSNMDVFLFYIGFVVNICCLGVTPKHPGFYFTDYYEVGALFLWSDTIVVGA